MTKSKMNVQAAAAQHKVYIESNVSYVDPDFTAARKMKAETIAANAKFEAMKKAEAEADEIAPFVWGESK